jgi:hypothetical protein
MTSKGLSTSYKNLTLFGLSRAESCGKLKKKFNQWKAELCLATLTSSVDSVTGPGVPFKGRVAAIFKRPKLEFRYFSVTFAVPRSAASRSPATRSVVPLSAAPRYVAPCLSARPLAMRPLAMQPLRDPPSSPRILKC